jgi:hypothetical protein
MYPTQKQDIALRASLAAIEDACTASKEGATELDADVIMYHVLTVRDRLSVVQQQTEITLEEVEAVINCDISKEEFVELPGSDGPSKSRFLYDIISKVLKQNTKNSCMTNHQ